MVGAFLRALAELSAPALRRFVWLGLALALATFALLWVGVAILLYHTTLFGWRPLNWLVDLLGALAVAVLSWLLFPAVVTTAMGFFLDRIAGEVEALDYPGRGPPRRAPLGETMQTTARLTILTMLLNLLALPVYVLAPGLNFFVFLGLNGYLLGREYFEVVALRRLDPAEARTMRRRFAGRLFFGGVTIAALFAIPVVNLLAPLLATIFMVHLFEGWRGSERQPPAARFA